MSHTPSELINDPTYKKYHVKCKVKFYTKNVSDDLGAKGINQYTRKMVLLIPQDSDEMVKFLNAWMPSTLGQHHELTGSIGGPVHSPCRFAIFMGHDEKCERPYLFVMSKGVEDIIVKFVKEGMVLNVTTHSAAETEGADDAQDASDGNFEVIS